MRIVFIGTYLPQECGIATFTNNLAKSIALHLNEKDATEMSFIALQQEGNDISFPEEVKFVIRQQVLEDYKKAAEFINTGGFDMCIIQHEYGIFGGESGVYIQTLASLLTVPFMVTAHTILKQPSAQQRSIMKWLAARGERLVVMSNKARQFLRDIYEIPAKKIFIIEHGVPRKMDVNKEEIRNEFGLKGKVLMTFGLLGRNKGIETVIRALPAVVQKHPDLVYFVLGNTHPNVIRHEGEKYRDELMALATELGVEKNLVFRKGFMTEEKLFELLHSIDIYITPYLNEEQITSGTLSYAIGAGAAIISTPYWHAQELLADDRGRLFNFKDDQQLGGIINSLLDDSKGIEALRTNALIYAHHLRWKNAGKRYLTLSENIVKGLEQTAANKLPSTFVEPGLNHLKRLTDGIGIYQHSVFGLPNYHEGYCLDDNARALIAMTMAAEQGYDRQTADNANVYLSFIHFMQQPDGWFHNFLGFDRRMLDEECSEDAYGRAMWALGYLLSSDKFSSLHRPAEQIFIKALHHANDLEHIRGMADTVIGLRYFLEKNATHNEAHAILRSLSAKLIVEYTKHTRDGWNWFADSLTYDNGILPLALFHAYEITGDEETKNVAEASALFLQEVTMSKGYLSLIGSNGWYNRHGSKAKYPQQAIDAMAMVLLYKQAFDTTKNTLYLDCMTKCYRWFFFENDLCTSLYEPTTQGCYDGLEDYGINQNQGAESTLALFISHYAVSETLKGAGLAQDSAKDKQTKVEEQQYNSFKENFKKSHPSFSNN